MEFYGLLTQCQALIDLILLKFLLAVLSRH